MAVIKCKMCGGDIELSQDQSIGTCQYCGSTMTLPKVDDQQRAAVFDRGNHFRRLGEFDKALSVYERIVQEDENDAEAHWCCALCRFGIEYVKDPASGEYLPTCHRASFDSFLEDVDYKAALAHADAIARRQYEQDGEKIAAVQRGILSTVQKEEPFDVFICYKETDDRGQRTIDSTLAQEIYYQLTEQGRRVFFARITLEDKAGQEYEPYIFAALHSAKVMVVVGTRPEYLNAVWVKNEWSRYLALMKNDRKRLLIPCYRDMDPYDLPEQLSVLQSYDMSKIGFIQDLIRGIAKVLDADKKPEPTRETVVVQGEGGNLAALLKRGNIALEDRDWAKADEFFERALDIDAECAEAYLGKALAERKCSTLERLAQVLTDVEAVSEQATVTFPDTDTQLQALIDRYQIPGYLTEETIRENFDVGSSRKYPIVLPFWERRPWEVGEYFENNKLMSRAMRYARGECAQSLQTLQERVDSILQARITNARETDRKQEENVRADQARKLQVVESRIQQLHEEAAQKREADYATACSAMERGELQRAIGMLGDLGDYRDSADLLNRCREESERLKAEEKAAKEKEERAKQEAKEKAEKAAQEARAEAKKRNKKIAIISGIAAVLVIAVVLVMTQVVIPGNKYKDAEALLAAGEYDAAIEAFTALGGYSDARNRVTEVLNIKSAAAYDKAEALLANAEYDAAIIAFSSLGNYADAKERVTEATNAKNDAAYARAEALLVAGKYDAAIDAFAALGVYSDARDRVKEVSYAKGEDLLAQGEKAAAAAVFWNLGDYSDADTRAQVLWDEIMVRETISAGAYHTVGLKTNGTVVATKGQYYGQSDVSNWTNIVAISAGWAHTIGLKSDGTVVAVGDKSSGQCNVSAWTDIVTISAHSDHTVGLKADGTVVAVGDNSSGQRNVSAWTDIVAISAGNKYTAGLKSGGTVVAVGDNEYGQCDVSGWRDIVAISAGGYHTVGLKSDGTVVAVGDNEKGQCNVSAWKDIIAIAAGTRCTVGLQSDGTVVVVGGTSGDVSDWTDIVAVAVGPLCIVGVRADGTVVATGNNGYGQCDVSGWSDIKVPNR